MERHIKTVPGDLKYSTLTTAVEGDNLGKIEPVDFDGLYEVQLADDLPDGTTVVNRRIVSFDDVIVCEHGSAVTVQDYFSSKSPQQEGELKSDDGDYFTVLEEGDESSNGGAERGNNDELLFHGMPLCGNPKMYFCTKCGNSFNAAGSLKLHTRACLKEREEESEEQRTCAICDKVFHSVTYLKEHIKRHSSGVGTRGCTHCYRRFTEEAKWKAHMEDHKTREKLNAEAAALAVDDGKKKVLKEFTCSFCSVKFKVTFDEGQAKRRYSCDDCRTKYSNPERLKQRKETMNVRREYFCDRCGRKFVFEGFLQRHLPKCDGTFKRRRDLNVK